MRGKLLSLGLNLGSCQKKKKKKSLNLGSLCINHLPKKLMLCKNKFNNLINILLTSTCMKR
jgi:hypothetical protein